MTHHNKLFTFLAVAVVLVMALTVKHVLAVIGFDGHVATTNIGYTDGTHITTYTAAPNMRQGNSSAAAAKSTIAACDATDLYVNFTYDTGGKSVYLVYATGGTTPTKTAGTSVSATFSKFDSGSGDRTWVAQIPASANTAGTEVRYVFYISNSDLASAWGRVAGTNGNGYGYSTSWTEGDAYFSYTPRYGTSGTGSGNWSSGSTWTGGSVPNSSTADVEICNGKTVTLDANETVKSITINNGATFNGSSNTLSIAASGSVTNNGTFTASSGTVSFAGSGTISGNATTFNNVTIAGGVDFGSSLSTVNGTLTITTGGYVNNNPPTYGGSSTLKYNTGNASTNMYHVNLDWKTGASGAGVPNNVLLSSNTWIDFATNTGSRTAAGTLIIDAGSGLDLGTSPTSSLTVAGSVTNNGTIKQAKSLASGSYNFTTITDGASTTKYYGVGIAANADMGTVTVSVAGNQVCGTPPLASGSLPVKRCFDISRTGAGSGNITFYYHKDEMQSGQTYSSLKAWHNTGGSNWALAGSTGHDGDKGSCGPSDIDCYVLVNNVSSFSPFVLQNTNPTAAVLSAFAADADRSGVMVTWETASELGNLGFNLYRATAESGPWARVNPAVIQSRSPGSPEGFSYAWLDRPPARGTYWYRLAGVGYDGRETELDTASVSYPYGWLWLPVVGWR